WRSGAQTRASSGGPSDDPSPRAKRGTGRSGSVVPVSPSAPLPEPASDPLSEASSGVSRPRSGGGGEPLAGPCDDPPLPSGSEGSNVVEPTLSSLQLESSSAKLHTTLDRCAIATSVASGRVARIGDRFTWACKTLVRGESAPDASSARAEHHRTREPSASPRRSVRDRSSRGLPAAAC